jgi:drug/metabolite transporter (DMT)-like permease
VNDALQQRALGAGLLLVLLWGASFTIQKAAYTAMGPGGFLFGRSLVMSLCAVLLLRWRGSPLWPPLARPEWAVLLSATALGPVAHIVLVTYGIHWSTPFSSSLIMACGPVCTLILLRLLRGTRLQRHQLLGVGAAFGGVLLFMSEKLLKADLRASGGDLMMLVATVVFSLYTIWVTPLVARHGGPEVLCWATLLASPLMLALTFAAAVDAPYATIGPGIWSAFFWTVLVSAFVGWMLWGWVNAVRGVARTAPLLYLVPPVAGVVAWLTVGEAYSGLKLGGAALALAGVAWTQFGAGRAAAA